MFKNIISKSNRDQFIEESDISFCSSEEADERTIQHAINLNLGKSSFHQVLNLVNIFPTSALTLRKVFHNRDRKLGFLFPLFLWLENHL